MLIKIRQKLITILAGKMPVVMNCHVSKNIILYGDHALITNCSISVSKGSAIEVKSGFDNYPLELPDNLSGLKRLES